MLSLYRSALRLRRSLPALGDGEMQWLESSDAVLVFTREPGFGCLVNFGSSPVPLPSGAEVLLSSDPLGTDGTVPSDTTVWFRRP
jgi:alpha-glucosidase